MAGSVSVPAMAIPVPAYPSEFTADWFSEVLRTEVVAASVPAPVGTGQMADSYRVHLTYAPGTEGGPASVVVKHGSPEASDLAASGYAAEVRFYNEIAPTVALRLPHCWFAGMVDGGKPFAIVLEDLAPATQGNEIEGASIEQAELALTNLADLHGPRWNDLSLASFAGVDYDPSLSSMLGDYQRLATIEFKERYDTRLAPGDLSMLEEFSGLVGQWRATRPRPFAVQHGDYRLDNLLFAPGMCATVDFQTAAVGPPSNDVSYFCAISLRPDDRRAHERALLDGYHTRLGSHGVTGYSSEQLWEDYRLGVGHTVVVTVLGAGPHSAPTAVTTCSSRWPPARALPCGTSEPWISSGRPDRPIGPTSPVMKTQSIRFTPCRRG